MSWRRDGYGRGRGSWVSARAAGLGAALGVGNAASGVGAAVLFGGVTVKGGRRQAKGRIGAPPATGRREKRRAGRLSIQEDVHFHSTSTPPRSVHLSFSDFFKCALLTYLQNNSE